MFKRFSGFNPTAKEKEVLDFYTRIGTYDIVREKISSVPEDEMYENGLYYTDNTRVNLLIGCVERLLYNLRSPKFTSIKLILSMWELRGVVVKNDLYKDFNYLLYLYYVRSKNRIKNTNLYLACVDLLLNLAVYIYGPYVPYYIDYEGYIIVDESNRKSLDYDDYCYLKAFEKTNILTSKINQINLESRNADSKLRSRLFMSNFLRNNDSLFWSNQLIGIRTSATVFNTWGDNNQLMDVLLHRTKMLPKEGISFTIKHLTGFEKIFLKEKIYQNGVVILLFNLRNITGLDITGFCDINNQVLYSCLSDGMIDMHWLNFDFISGVENLVLQAYAFLTTDLVPQRNKVKALKIYESAKEYNACHRLSQISLVRDEAKKHDSQERGYAVKGEREVSLRQIEPFFRRLPAGYSASDESIKNANEYGYELPVGYTFVTGFEKQVWVKA